MIADPGISHQGMSDTGMSDPGTSDPGTSSPQMSNPGVFRMKRGSEMVKRYALFALLLFPIPASAAQRPSRDPATQTISPAPSFEPVTNERLLNSDAEPENWLMYSGNYFSQRYSGLDQINNNNAGQLEMQWAFQLRALDRAETTPLVVDGVMYVTEAPSNVIALDARTGSQYWRYNHNLPDDLNYCCGRNNRGVAVLAIGSV